MTVYIVGAIKESARLSIGMDLDLRSLAAGCVGLLPVFATREAAEQYADGRYPVMEAQFAEKEKQ